MEVYFNNSFGNISKNEQDLLLQRLVQCRYDSNKATGSQKFPFVNEDGVDADWIKKEGKVMSISPNGKDRHCKARFFAHYDPKTDRMYISHFISDHFSEKGSRKNDMYAKNGVDGHIMEKINAHQAALNSGQNPEGLGFEDAKVHLNARQTTGIAKERLDLDDVFNSKPHLKEVCENLQGEFHNIKNQKDLDTLKEMCLDPENDLLPKTESGKKILLQYAENDSEFKKFLENTYTKFEKKHPLTTDAEILKL